MTEIDRPTMLVVDDDPLVVEMVGQTFQAEGYHVLTAPSGAQALDVCASSGRRVDLLLTDLHMPGMTGRMLAAMLRKSQPGLRVIYLTGFAGDLFTSLMLEPHEKFIEKPPPLRRFATPSICTSVWHVP